MRAPAAPLRKNPLIRKRLVPDVNAVEHGCYGNACVGDVKESPRQDENVHQHQLSPTGRCGGVFILLHPRPLAWSVLKSELRSAFMTAAVLPSRMISTCYPRLWRTNSQTTAKQQRRLWLVCMRQQLRQGVQQRRQRQQARLPWPEGRRRRLWVLVLHHQQLYQR